MGGVALDRLDEVRDQVGATLELHRDVAPRLVDAHVELDEAVVGRPQVDPDDHSEGDDDQDRNEPFPHSQVSVRLLNSS